MKASFNLDGKTDSKNIMLILRHQNLKRKLSTGLKINKDSWNPNKQRVTKKNDNYLKFNTRLNEIELKANSILDSYKISGNFDLFSIRNEIRDTISIEKVHQSSSDLFWSHYEQFLHSKRHSNNTYKNFKTILKALKGFEADNNIKLNYDLLDINFRDKLIEYLIYTKEISTPTASNYIQKLITFLNWGFVRKFHDNEIFKTREFKLDAKGHESTQIALDEIEINIIENYKPKNSIETKTKDIFLFMIYTGQRFSDYVTMTRNEIVEDVWELTQTKTKKNVIVPLNKRAKNILKKYEHLTKPLPMISYQNINETIKDICKSCNIDKKIERKFSKLGKIQKETVPKYKMVSCHTTRRTFITVSLSKGMNPEMVKKISGNKNIDVFSKYIKFDNDQLISQMKSCWN